MEKEDFNKEAFDKAVEDAVSKAVEARLGKKMSDTEKMENASQFRDTMFQGVQVAEGRTESVADDFVKLEVTIATLMLGFSSFFLTFFSPSAIDVPTLGLILMKVSFSIGMILLFASLSCGLMYLKTAQSFWNDVLNQRFIRFKMWNKVPKREATFEQALAYHDGTTLEKGNITEVPKWTWILQTVFLGIALAIFVTLVMVYLFSSPLVANPLPQ